MSQPGILQQFLADTIEATLRAAGNPFGLKAETTITLATAQRKQLVAGLGAVRADLAGVEHEQRIADELATLCHKLTTRGAPTR